MKKSNFRRRLLVMLLLSGIGVAIAILSLNAQARREGELSRTFEESRRRTVTAPSKY